MDNIKQQSKIITGTGASSGVAKGIVQIIFSETDFVNFENGQVLVAHTTNPSFTPLLALAAAVVTDIGSKLSHAAIVARELNIPAVVATETATKKLRDGDVVVVDGDRGIVHLLPSIDKW